MHTWAALTGRLQLRCARWLVRGPAVPVILMGTLAIAGLGSVASDRVRGAGQSQLRALATPSSQAVDDRGFAGHWVLTSLFRCEGAAAAAPLCDRSFIDVPGAITEQSTVNIDSDAQGHLTFQYALTISGKGTEISPQCNAELFTGAPMTGICRITSHGRGYFSRGVGNLPAFWVSDEWVTFHGIRVVRAVHDPINLTVRGVYPQEWLIPAVSGHYDSGAWSGLMGWSPFAPGKVLQESVTRS
jgi:hypothetical protein